MSGRQSHDQRVGQVTTKDVSVNAGETDFRSTKTYYQAAGTLLEIRARPAMSLPWFLVDHL